MGKRTKAKKRKPSRGALVPRHAVPARRPRPRGMVASRDYAGSLQDRLTQSFTGEYASANEVVRQSLCRLRARSRELVMDNDYAKNYIRILQRNVIGPKGIRLQAKARRPDGTLDASDNAAIESAWQEWGRYGTCTLNGSMSWLDVQRMVVRTLATDGEVLVRLYPGGNTNAFGFAVEVIESDWLDVELNKRIDDDREIVMGVEINGDGRPLAYHLLREHPGRIMGRRARSGHERVRAEFMLHVYVADRPGQLRGIPWTHTAVRRLHMLGGYEEAEVVASRAASQKMGFLKTPTGTEYVGEAEASDGAHLTHFEAGTVEQLPQGWDFEGWAPDHPTTAFPATVKQLLRGASAGLGASYNTLAQDLEGVSFSSIRTGVLDDRDEWMSLQTWLIERLPERVLAAWLPMALLTAQIVGPGGPLPGSRQDKFRAHEWRTRGWAWVDPVKDQETNERQVLSGWKTSADVAGEQGRDLEDVYRQLAEEQRLREELGIQVTMGKAAPPQEPAETADG